MRVVKSSLVRLFIPVSKLIRVKNQKMDYVSIDQFNQGWKFFAKEIEDRYGDAKFPCSKFSCTVPNCNDWLDAHNHNRNVDKV